MKTVYKWIIKVESSVVYHSEEAEKWEAGVSHVFL